MDKSVAKVVKKGSKWCVVSESSGRGLGCYSSKNEAVTRLKQVEYFKHHSKGSDMNYESVFNKIAQNLGLENKLSEQSEVAKAVTDPLYKGTIAGRVSAKLLDKKNHFPVLTETQARSSLTRVLQLNTVPDWYQGTLQELQKEVYDGAIAAQPGAANLNISVSINKVQALSDGQTPSELSESEIENPADCVKTKVPGVDRPTITTAELQTIYDNDQARSTLAGQLMENISQQEESLAEAKKLASKLLKKGLSGEDFTALCTYLQENILREMLFSDQMSSDASIENRRRELLDRMKDNK